MINTALIIKNVSHENPGLILDVLKELGIKYDMIDLSVELNLPQIDSYSFIIIMGGPDSANDESEKISKELEYIKLALKKKIPLFGICLGMQLMVKAFGGDVYKNPVKEIGFKYGDKWYLIELTPKGINDPLFQGIEKTFSVFQLHGETVKINENFELLALGEYCANQIIKIGAFNYGVQFHFELSKDLLNDWLELAPELQDQDKFSIKQDFELIYDSFIKRGKKIIKNYLNILNF